MTQAKELFKEGFRKARSTKVEAKPEAESYFVDVAKRKQEQGLVLNAQEKQLLGLTKRSKSSAREVKNA